MPTPQFADFRTSPTPRNANENSRAPWAQRFTTREEHNADPYRNFVDRNFKYDVQDSRKLTHRRGFLLNNQNLGGNFQHVHMNPEFGKRIPASVHRSIPYKTYVERAISPSLLFTPIPMAAGIPSPFGLHSNIAFNSHHLNHPQKLSSSIPSAELSSRSPEVTFDDSPEFSRHQYKQHQSTPFLNSESSSAASISHSTSDTHRGIGTNFNTAESVQTLNNHQQLELNGNPTIPIITKAKLFGSSISKPKGLVISHSHIGVRTHNPVLNKPVRVNFQYPQNIIRERITNTPQDFAGEQNSPENHIQFNEKPASHERKQQKNNSGRTPNISRFETTPRTHFKNNFDTEVHSSTIQPIYDISYLSRGTERGKSINWDPHRKTNSKLPLNGPRANRPVQIDSISSSFEKFKANSNENTPSLAQQYELHPQLVENGNPKTNNINFNSDAFDIHEKNVNPTLLQPTIIKLTGIPINPAVMKESSFQTNKNEANAVEQHTGQSHLDDTRDTSALQIRSKVLSNIVRRLPPYKKCFHNDHTWMCPPIPQQTGFFSSENDQSSASQVVVNTEIRGLDAGQVIGNTNDKISETSAGNNFVSNSRRQIPVNLKQGSDSERRTISVPSKENKNLHVSDKRGNQKFYTKCDHPFHSWLCPEESTKIKFQPPISTTPTPNSPPLTVAPVAKSLIKVPSTDTTETSSPNSQKSPPSSIQPATGYSKCSHSFHTWLCPKAPNIRNQKEANIPTRPSQTRGKSLLDRGTTVSPPKTQFPSRTTEIITVLKRIQKPNSKPSPLPNVIPTESPTNIQTQEPELTSPSTKQKDYDKCSHPFHAWLCQKPIRNRLSSLAVPSKSRLITPLLRASATTEKPAVQTIITGLTEQKVTIPSSSQTFFDNNKRGKTLGPPVTPPTKIIPLSSPKTEAPQSDLCTSHPWMCALTKPQLPKAEPLENENKSTNDQPLIRVRDNHTNQVLGWSDKNPCTHPFHSWLCKRNNGTNPKTTPKPLPKALDPQLAQVSLFLRNIASTTHRPIIVTEALKGKSFNNKDNSNDFQTIDKSPVIFGPILPEINSNQPDTKLLTFDPNDPCSHPFHSYLCKQTPTTRAPHTQSLPPPIKLHRGNSSPSQPLGKSIGVETENKHPQPYAKGDKCSHPFHSWLCAIAQNLGPENEKSAIDSLIDSDRFLLKTSNLPDIRQLPLDTESTSTEIRNLFDEDRLNAAQLAFPTKHWENLKATGQFDYFYQAEKISHSPTEAPADAGSSRGNSETFIVPTLPSLKMQSFTTSPPPSFSFIDSQGLLTKTKPFNTKNELGFRAPSPITFDLNDIGTVPPRPIREVQSHFKVGNNLKDTSNNSDSIDSKDSFLPTIHTQQSRQRHRKSKLEDSFTTSKNTEIRHPEKDSGFSPSFHFGTHKLHHASPFLPFPSITNQESPKQTPTEPPVIIKSNFSDHIPSSTVTDGDASGHNSGRIKWPNDEITRAIRNQKLPINIDATAALWPTSQTNQRQKQSLETSNSGNNQASDLTEGQRVQIFDNHNKVLQRHYQYSFPRFDDTAHLAPSFGNSFNKVQGDHRVLFIPSPRDGWRNVEYQPNFVPSNFQAQQTDQRSVASNFNPILDQQEQSGSYHVGTGVMQHTEKNMNRDLFFPTFSLQRHDLLRNPFIGRTANVHGIQNHDFRGSASDPPQVLVPPPPRYYVDNDPNHFPQQDQRSSLYSRQHDSTNVHRNRRKRRKLRRKKIIRRKLISGNQAFENIVLRSR